MYNMSLKDTWDINMLIKFTKNLLNLKIYLVNRITMIKGLM
jgi:hypothetical protein